MRPGEAGANRLFWGALLLFLWVPAMAQQAPEQRQAMRFGLRVEPPEWAAMEETLAADPCDPGNPLGVTLDIPSPWADRPDWSALEKAAAAVTAAHARLIIVTKLPDRSRGPYLATLSERFGSRAEALELSLAPPDLEALAREGQERQALEIKRWTALLRGGSKADLLLGNLAPELLRLLSPLYQESLGAYLDGYGGGPFPSEQLLPPAVPRFIQEHHLGADLLLHLARVRTPIAAQLLVLAAGDRGVTWTDVEGESPRVIWKALLDLRADLPRPMGPGYATEATSLAGPSGPRADIGLINLLDPDSLLQGIVLVPTREGSSAAPLELHLPTLDITSPKALRLPSGRPFPIESTPDLGKEETVLRVPWEGSPLLLLFQRQRNAVVGEQRLSVVGAYHLPVEVILARHQAVQEEQDLFLQNVTADARVDYNFQMPGGTGTLPITFLNEFFHSKSQGSSWVQRQLLMGGLPWKGKIPELPIIQPEEANTLPMALTLGHAYRYRYIGQSEADGHACYELGFSPAPGAAGNLYEGKAWVDTRSFVTVKMEVSQGHLERPQVGNRETDHFAPFPGPDGRTYWLLSRVEGLQIFSMGPVTLTASRTVVFTHLEVNNPRYQSLFAAAERSDRPILQETSAGYRYLVKRPDGSRQLRMKPKHSWFLGIAGLYHDPGFSNTLPLVGVEYFDSDWMGTNSQMQVFASGALNTLILSKVNLWPRVDGEMHGTFFLVPMLDRVYLDGQEDRRQRLKDFSEDLGGSLAWRFTPATKLALTMDATYRGFRTSSFTSPLFAMPSNHFDLGTGLDFTGAWGGFSTEATWEAHHRTQWQPWGLPGRQGEDSLSRDYRLWSLAVSQNFSLTSTQKLAVGLTWLDGERLDRFSRYQFTWMGPQSLAGFSGSGVRFERGSIGTLSYTFNLADVVHLGLMVQRARVQLDRLEGPWEDHTGVGLQAAVGGPAHTYITASIGYALHSDVPSVKGQRVVFLRIWKLF